MPIVDVPGMGVVEFPDGTSNEVMENAIKDFQSQSKPQSLPQQTAPPLGTYADDAQQARDAAAAALRKQVAPEGGREEGYLSSPRGLAVSGATVLTGAIPITPALGAAARYVPDLAKAAVPFGLKAASRYMGLPAEVGDYLGDLGLVKLFGIGGKEAAKDAAKVTGEAVASGVTKGVKSATESFQPTLDEMIKMLNRQGGKFASPNDAAMFRPPPGTPRPAATPPPSGPLGTPPPASPPPGAAGPKPWATAPGGPPSPGPPPTPGTPEAMVEMMKRFGLDL